MYRQLISNSWKACLLFVCVFFSGITVKADDSLYSPNKKIGVSWDNPVKGLRVIYKKGDVPISVVQLENIGLPPRWMYPNTVSRVSNPVSYSISSAMYCAAFLPPIVGIPSATTTIE